MIRSKTALIVDFRLTKELYISIEKHMDYLPGWRLIHVKDSKINTFFAYQRLFLNVDFWNSLNCEKILVFQKDSEILKFGVEDFWNLDYSYIGAPWKTNSPWARKDRKGGNGGISLRNVRDHIEILKKNKPPKIIDLKIGKGICEDVWFTHNLPKVAPYDVCKKFSVESEFQLNTICAHAIDRHLSKKECLKIRSQYNKKFL